MQLHACRTARTRWIGGMVGLLVASALPAPMLAQDVEIRGIVRGRGLAPLPGVQVDLIGVGITTATDGSGAFRLVVREAEVERTDTLRARFMGYRSRAVPVVLSSGAKALDIMLSEEAIALDEVVVTGTAGTQERRAQAAAVGVVNAADLARNAPIASLPELLQGRVASLSLNPSSGSAGSAPRIFVRGTGSISLSNEPLLFIDGVRADSRTMSGNANGGQALSRLDDLNPEDIERIEVLKGPAAATFYGADASAGVIQVITKRGSTAERGFRQSVLLEYNRVDPNWRPPSNFARCRAADVAADSPALLCREKSPGEVISDNPLLRSGVLTDGHLRSFTWSGQGGGSDYGYYLSLGTDDEDGTLPQNAFQRRSARLSFRFVPDPRVSFDAGLGVIRTATELPQNQDNPAGFLTGLIGSPLTVGSDLDGWFRLGPAVMSTVTQQNLLQRLTPTLTVRHEPTAGFHHRLSLGADLSHSEGTTHFPRNDAWGVGRFAQGYLFQDRIHHDLFTLDYLANLRLLERQPGPWKADLSAGLQVVSRREDILEGHGWGFISNGAHTLTNAATRTSEQYAWEERAVGLLGQAQLVYGNRAFLQIGARVDRNSSFGSAAEPFVLPKAGLSYVVSEEPYWRNHVPFISTLRVRLAYGTTGRSPPPGAALQTYRAAPFLFRSGEIRQGVYPLSPGNEDLVAERGTEIEAGIDAAILAGRIALELTWFRQTTRDVLLPYPRPPSYGFSADPWTNIGEVRNRGLEVALRGEIISNARVQWDARLNLATLKNELVSLGGVEPFSVGHGRFAEGQPLGALFSHRVLRNDPGSGRAVVTDSAEFVGRTQPRIQGGLETRVALGRQVRLHGHFDWKLGHRQFNGTTHYREQSGIAERAVLADRLPDAERLRRFGPYVREDGSAVPLSEVSVPYLEDASFLRWREFALTYDLPPRLLRAVRISGGSIMIGGRNLRLWTRYEGDPEVITFVSEGGQAQFLSSDFLTLPQPRRWITRFTLHF